MKKYFNSLAAWVVMPYHVAKVTVLQGLSLYFDAKLVSAQDSCIKAAEKYDW